MGFADIMRNGCSGRARPRTPSTPQLIHESGAHLLELINDVLDMSKRGRALPPLQEVFDAREAINAVAPADAAQADEAASPARGCSR
jgi:signal transduction histidine kinase